MRQKKDKQYSLTFGGEEIKKDNFEEVHSDKSKQLANQVKKLESEKKELIKQLESIELKKSGLSPEELGKTSLLSLRETETLRKRVQECDRVLKGQSEEVASSQYQGERGYSISTRYDLFQEKQAAKQQKFQAQKTLATNSARDVSVKEKDYLRTRKKELEDVLKKRIAAVGDEWDRSDSYEFNKTVHNVVEFEEQCGNLIRELKNINKLLDPLNPMAGDIGYLYRTRKRNA